jgi:hypothetical protein
MGGAVDDDMANLIVAQLLYLDSEVQPDSLFLLVHRFDASCSWRMRSTMRASVWPSYEVKFKSANATFEWG